MKKIISIICIIFCIMSLATFTACKKQENQLATYTIFAEYHSAGAISAKMLFEYCSDISDDLSSIKFNLFPSAFRENASFSIVEQGHSYGGIEILNVLGDQVLDYEICGNDKNILKVNFKNAISKGDNVSLEIDFVSTLPQGDYRFCKGENTINIGNWYPVMCVYENNAFYECDYYSIGDPFYTRVANYFVELTVPSQMVVCASGTAKSCENSGAKTTYAYTLENARDFAFCLSDKFQVISKKALHSTVNYYYFSDTEPEKTIDTIVLALDWLSQVFGEYPYQTFSVAQSDFCEGGMEYPGLVYVNAKIDGDNKLYTAVHETAHQWWYGVVGNNQLEEAFLDEGLTEYSTAVFFSENSTIGVNAEKIFLTAENSCRAYAEILQALGKSNDFCMKKHLKDFLGEYDYVNLTYNRGLTMMRTAENIVGRQKLLSLLRKYYDNYKFQIATTDDFLKSMKQASGVIKPFIYGNAVI